MARSMAVALLLFAGVLAAAAGDDAPSFDKCEVSAMSMGNGEFVTRALGGSPSCVDADDKSACCDQVRGLFGEGGAAEFCMCNVEFFSVILTDLPTHNDINPSDYADMLEECGVPMAGKTTCPGVEVETPVEPVVQAQALIAKKLLLKKKLKKKAVGAAALAALARRRGGGGGGSGVQGSSTTPAPAPAPAPALAPVPAPAPAVLVVKQPKKAVHVPAPKKGGPVKTVVETVEPAEMVEPAAPAVVTPKVTAPAISPKVTAAGKR